MDAARIGDIGTTFRMTVRDANGIVDLTSTTGNQIVFRKPSGTVVRKTATLTTDGSDGQIEWVTTSASDLNEPGDWEMEPYATPGGNGLTGTRVKFRVDPIL